MANPLLFAAAGCTAVILLAARRRPHGRTDATRNKTPDRDADVYDPAYDERLDKIERLLESFVADDPTPGFFYQVQEGDTLPGIASEALRTVGRFTQRQLEQYIYCISSGPRWNVPRYATPSVTKRFGRDMLVPGLGKGIRVAFEARNEDALGSMLEGVLPKMRVDPKSGAAASEQHRSYGLPWLPPVDRTELRRGEVTCAAFSWPDGSSSIDPPPELLALLEA